jgi:hypothetical protein
MHKYCLFLIFFEFDYLLKEDLGGKTLMIVLARLMLCSYFAKEKFWFLLGKWTGANAPVACKKVFWRL